MAATGGPSVAWLAGGVIPPKAFCPCDLNRPQDCKPETWPGAHSARSCAICGCPDYQHRYVEQDADPDQAPSVTVFCPPPGPLRDRGQHYAAVDAGTACWTNGGCLPTGNDRAGGAG